MYLYADILESRLLLNDGSNYFTTHTSHGLVRRKETIIAPSWTADVHGSTSSRSGSIKWKDETFVIGGVVKRVSDLRSRRFLSRSQEWRWSGSQYTLKYSGNQWMIKCGEVGASMKVYQFHVFRQSEPASVSFSSNLSVEDMIFLLLVLVYSETKRQDGIKSSRAAATG